MKINFRSRPCASQWNYLVGCYGGDLQYQYSWHQCPSRFIATPIQAFCEKSGYNSELVMRWDDTQKKWVMSPTPPEWGKCPFVEFGIMQSSCDDIVASLPSLQSQGAIVLDGQGEYDRAALTASDLFLYDYVPCEVEPPATTINPLAVNGNFAFQSTITTLTQDVQITGGVAGLVDSGANLWYPVERAFLSVPAPTQLPFPGLLAALPGGCVVSADYTDAVLPAVTRYTAMTGTLSDSGGTRSVTYTTTTDDVTVYPDMIFLACFAERFIQDGAVNKTKCRYVELGIDEDPLAAMYRMRSQPQFLGIAAVHKEVKTLYTDLTIQGIKDALLEYLPDASYDIYETTDDSQDYRGYITSASYKQVVSWGGIDISKIKFSVTYPDSSCTPIIHPLDWPRMD